MERTPAGRTNVGDVPCRDLFERRYPYLSGGARTDLGTPCAGLLNRASRPDQAATPAELHPWGLGGCVWRVASPAVARILIVGGGCRGRRLAAQLVKEGGHAVRITTRGEAGRAAIEATGAECLIGTPDRLATLRGALDGVTIACWMLATAQGDRAQVEALHGSRLESFLGQAIDTTMRGFVYESADATVAAEMHDAGERIVRRTGKRNAIPVAVLRVDIEDPEAWQAEAQAAVERLLGDRNGSRDALSSN